MFTNITFTVTPLFFFSVQPYGFYRDRVVQGAGESGTEGRPPGDSSDGRMQSGAFGGEDPRVSKAWRVARGTT